MKKKFLVTLMLAMGLALAGCGKEEVEEAPTEAVVADTDEDTEAEAVTEEEVAEKEMSYDGEWLENKAVKIGVPTGWTVDTDTYDDDNACAAITLIEDETKTYVKISIMTVGMDYTREPSEVKDMFTTDVNGADVKDAEIDGISFYMAEYPKSEDSPVLQRSYRAVSKAYTPVHYEMENETYVINITIFSFSDTDNPDFAFTDKILDSITFTDLPEGYELNR